MQSDKKLVAADFRALAKEFSRIASAARARPLEDVALDYHDVAERAGVLLIGAYRAGLLDKVPGLAKLMDRGLDSARLFKQFHGYEVNVGVLLSGPSPDAQPKDTAMTCGLLPQLLPDHPLFRRKAYRGKNASRHALSTELRRAAEACVWLADQTAVDEGDRSAASKRRPATKTSVKALADLANARRKPKPKSRENPLGLGKDVKCRSR